VAQAQASVDQARASLEKLHQPAKATDVAQAQAAVDQARASLQKLQRPADANDVAQTQASLNSAQAALDDLKAGAKATDLAGALASVKQAEAARDLARAKVDDATITAPFAGVVATVSAIPGQQASAGGSTALVTLVDDSTLSIDVRVAESDIGRIQVGQAARVTVEALPGQTIEGSVTAIAPKSTVESNVVSYLVTVSLAGQQAGGIKAGMTATVAIVTASKQDVLVVPNRAVQTQGQQKSVTVSVKGEQFSAPVQIGLVGASTSEVIAGLAEGDVVVTTGAATTTTTGATARPGGGLPGFGAPVMKP
jgi:HlyD family secretion protein